MKRKLKWTKRQLHLLKFQEGYLDVRWQSKALRDAGVKFEGLTWRIQKDGAIVRHADGARMITRRRGKAFEVSIVEVDGSSMTFGLSDDARQSQ